MLCSHSVCTIQTSLSHIRRQALEFQLLLVHFIVGQDWDSSMGSSHKMAAMGCVAQHKMAATSETGEKGTEIQNSAGMAPHLLHCEFLRRILLISFILLGALVSAVAWLANCSEFLYQSSTALALRGLEGSSLWWSASVTGTLVGFSSSGRQQHSKPYRVSGFSNQINFSHSPDKCYVRHTVEMKMAARSSHLLLLRVSGWKHFSKQGQGQASVVGPARTHGYWVLKASSEATTWDTLCLPTSFRACAYNMVQSVWSKLLVS